MEQLEAMYINALEAKDKRNAKQRSMDRSRERSRSRRREKPDSKSYKNQKKSHEDLDKGKEEKMDTSYTPKVKSEVHKTEGFDLGFGDSLKNIKFDKFYYDEDGKEAKSKRETATSGDERGRSRETKKEETKRSNNNKSNKSYDDDDRDNDKNRKRSQSRDSGYTTDRSSRSSTPNYHEKNRQRSLDKKRERSRSNSSYRSNSNYRRNNNYKKSYNNNNNYKKSNNNYKKYNRNSSKESYERKHTQNAYHNFKNLKRDKDGEILGFTLYSTYYTKCGSPECNTMHALGQKCESKN